MGWFTSLLSSFAGLFGAGGSSTSTSSTTAGLQYTQSGPTASFDWTKNAPEWKAIGITALALLVLGAWDKTRPLAIWIAIGLALLLLLGRYS